MKVKLVFEKSFVQEPRGLSANGFSKDVEVELPEGYDMAHLVSARCYTPDNKSPYPVAEHITATIWNYEDESYLIGKILTYIDATYSDKEQREAQKSIVKELVYGYYEQLRKRADQTIEAHS